MGKWHVKGLATCIVILMMTLPSVRATSNDRSGPDGPSQYET